MSIDNVVTEYESSLKVMVYNNHPRDIVIPQYYQYQKYVLEQDKESNYETIKDLVINYLRK
jgi:hypothetical protein